MSQVTSGRSDTANVYFQPIDPAVQLGPELTPALQSGDYLVVEAAFPADLDGEIRALRLRWPAFAVGADRNGNIVSEYRAQAIFQGYRGCENPTREFHVFIEGAKSHPAYDIYIVTASTLATKLYALDGVGPVLADSNDEEFLSDIAYRRALIKQVGTSLNGWAQKNHQIDESIYHNEIFPALNVVDVWKDYKDVAFPIITPYSADDVRKVAGKNSGYSFTDRIKRDAENWAVINGNPYSVAAIIGLGLIEAGTSLPSGWDEKSMTTGEELREAMTYDRALREAARRKDCRH